MEVPALLDDISFSVKQINYWQAQLFRQLADYADTCERAEFMEEEIAALLRWKSSYAFGQIMMTCELAAKLPRTLDAMEKGDVDYYKAKVLHEQTLPLTDEQAAEVEDRVLAEAADQTGAQLAARTRRIVMRVDPEGCAERAAERAKQRGTGMGDLEDDMAKLWAFLPAHKAVACALRVGKIARQARGEGDERTLDQIRADVVADLLLATPDNYSAVKVELHVTVSAATLMGLSEQPGELAGYGPITPALARELAGDATWRRLRTDPVTGTALEFGTSTYRPPAALRRFHLGPRPDMPPSRLHPPGPAIRNRPHRAVSERPTSTANTGPFCKRHHRVKHKAGWLTTQPEPGCFRFRGPAGKKYRRDPEPVFADLPPF